MKKTPLLELFKKRRTFTLLNILILYFIASSLIFTFLIPPFQKTDEVSHYFKTIAVANGNFFCQQDKNGEAYNTISQSYANLPIVLLSEFTGQSNNNRFPIAALKEAANITDNADQPKVKETVSCSLPFLLYAPVSILLFLPIQLHVPPIAVFYLGRLGFLLLGYLAVAGALKIIPKRYQILLMGYLILPMVGIQLGSFNKEVLHLAAGALVFASYFHLREKFSKKQLFLLTFSLFVVVLSRPFYVPLFVLIPLALPKRTTLPKRATKYLVISALVALSVFLLYIPKLAIFHNGYMNSAGVSAVLQLEFLRTNPMQFLSVLFSSYENHMTAYAKSLLGTYGSIHYYLDWYIYVFFGAWLLFLCVKYREELPRFSTKEIIGISFAIVAIVITSFFLFYLYATPVAFYYVIDVQGRYFINLLPFLILLTATVLKRHAHAVLVVALGLAMFFFVKNAYDRYYNYASGYIYEDAERLATISQESKLQTVEITQPITQHLTIDPQKKLRGVSFIVVNDDKRITNPLAVEFYDEGCQRILGKTMLMNHTKKTTTSIDVPLKVALEKNLCVKITPFSVQALNALPERLALDPDADQQKIFMMPFYAY